MKAVLYTRVSSKEQESEGYSLDAQLKLGREYARRTSLTLVREWRVSESAWSAGRKEFGQMVDFVKRHPEIEHIVFDCPDRMTRNDFDKVKISELVKDFGKTIHFARTGKLINRLSGSDDEFLFDIEVAVAKKMSNDISRKASIGMREKAEQGHYPGKPPLGYIINDKDSGIVPDPVNAPKVRKAFELMATGDFSLSQLVVHLSDNGFRTAKGNKIHKSSLSQMLSNPFYYGSFLWKDKLYSGKHEPLLTKDLFDRTNAVISGRGRSWQPRARGFALNGIATCGTCGCGVIGEKKKGKYLYYHCTYSKGRHPGRPYIPEREYAELFLPVVERVTLSHDYYEWLVKLVETYARRKSASSSSEIDILSQRHNSVADRIDKLCDKYLDGIIPEDTFSKKDAEYRRELSLIDSQIGALKMLRNVNLESGLKILELSKRLDSSYIDLPLEDKAKMLRLLSSNYVLNGRNISATYRSPFSLLANLPPRTVKLPRLDSNQRPAD